MDDLAKMRRKANDPNTPLATLQSIARDYPSLRPALALNPSTYPDLLTWLRNLDEPEINAALAQRSQLLAASADFETRAETSAKPAFASETGKAGKYSAEKYSEELNEPDEDQPFEETQDFNESGEGEYFDDAEEGETFDESEEFEEGEGENTKYVEHVGSLAEVENSENPQNAAEPDVGELTEISQPSNELTPLIPVDIDTPQPLPFPPEETPSGGYSLAQAAANSLTDHQALNTPPFGAQLRRSRESFTRQPVKKPSPNGYASLRKALINHPLRTLVVLLVLVAIALTIGIVVTNLHPGKNSASTNISVDKPTPITTGQTPTKTKKTPSGTATPYSELPEGYTGPVKTIEVPGPTAGKTIQKIVPDPDGVKPSQSPSKPSPKPSQTPAKTPTPTPSQTKTTNPLAPSANAKALDSFTSSDGNVRCVFSNTQVQCFANQLKAATNCETRQNDTGYTLILSGSNTLHADCVAPQNTNTQASLQGNETAKHGRFACKTSSNGDTVMCWDTNDGDGFVIGRSTIRRFTTGSKLPEFPK